MKAQGLHEIEWYRVGMILRLYNRIEAQFFLRDTPGMQLPPGGACTSGEADICRATDSEQLCCELPVVSRIGQGKGLSLSDGSGPEITDI